MQRLYSVALILFALAMLPCIMGVKGCNVVKIDEPNEIALGQQSAQEVEKQYHVVSGTSDAQRVARIGKAVAAATTRPNLPWTFKVVDDKSINAFSLPGGPVYVNQGLLDLGLSDDELAAVLGHEAEHIDQRHSVKEIEKIMVAKGISDIALSQTKSSDTTKVVVDMAIQLSLVLPQSREAEYEADALGARVAYNAGYQTDGMVKLLQRLAAMPEQPRTLEWLQDHPLMKSRVERAKRISIDVMAMKRPVPVALSAKDKSEIKNLPK